MIDLSNDRPIADDAPWLKTLQGNILKFHGRPQAAHIFFTFGGDSAAALAAIRRLVTERWITSAYEQDQQRRNYQARHKPGTPGDEREDPGERFASLLLTAQGYRALGFTDVDVRFRESSDEHEVDDLKTSFAAGMQEDPAHTELADPPVSGWDAHFRGRIDGLLLVARGTKQALRADVDAAKAVLKKGATILEVETGQVIVRDEQGIEHFGFVDGRSQPLFLRSDFGDPDMKTDAQGESTAPWMPFEPLERILIRDPYEKDDRCHGSFMVFRKLEQDVRGFRAALVQLAKRLEPKGDVGRAGALVVGRFENGTPVTLSGHPLPQVPPANNFTYAADIPMRKCPLQAHIRKVNPRGHTAGGTNPDTPTERQHRITRRSLTYGTHVPVTEPLEKLPRRGVGVLFMCYQASIRRQYAFMQRQWANAVPFPQGEVGADALTGHGDRSFHLWPKTHDELTEVPFTFEQFVHLKGGEFFFAPSLPFLERL